MKRSALMLLALTPMLAACGPDGGGTLAQLRGERMEVKEEPIEGGLEKAMASYKEFLDVTAQSSMTPEALRRLADLKLEKEYGLARAPAGSAKGQATPAPAAATDDEEKQQRADTLEAIALYKKLLANFPNYDRNDLVLYQMSRAYEELGEVDAAMETMNRLVKEYPRSSYVDEVQFRRGEFFFTRKKYLDAEEAYQAVVDRGHMSDFYEISLYKLGWTLYKQEMYEEGLHHFVALLDNRVATGAELENIQDDIERKRVEDTYRAISYSFSYLGGSEAIAGYFDKNGHRSFESGVYANLGEHFLEKRRYNDAAVTYRSFVKLNPLHKASPKFDMRVIEIYKEGDFPQLVIESNKAFARNYGIKSDYWKNFEKGSYPEVIGYLKKNLRELANHYHAHYQNPQANEDRETNYKEAQTWYREYLDSFPKEADSPPINHQYADLLMEHKEFVPAAQEYEHTAYGYPAHDKAAAAGYSAVAAWRENMKGTGDKGEARNELIRSSLRFVERFPGDDKAARVLGAAAEEMFEAKDYALAESTGRRVVENYANADPAVVRTGWLVVAHATFSQEKYADAETAFGNVLHLTAEKAPDREELGEKLAASIYKQGEAAAKAEDFAAAAEHYLRVGRAVPGTKIRPNAEFDGAAALVQIHDWERAAGVLQDFRKNYPKHALQPEVTKKIALVYKEGGKPALAAAEYERIETESRSEEVRRAALTLAADLYSQAGQGDKALHVYKRYADYFPRPLETMLEVRVKIADVYKKVGDKSAYEKELRQIVDADAKAGRERTDRTRFLAATSALALTEPYYDRLVDIRLVKPFDKNLKKKKEAMKAALDAFGKLTSYQVGEATAGATYYMAEIYYQFSKALMESERPDNLNAMELEQYNLALEEQAYPFEEKAIAIHQKNVELISLGVYNGWVDKSIGKLAALMPARYAKAEESTGFMETMGTFTYDAGRRPATGQGGNDAPSEKVATHGEKEAG